MPEHNIDLTWSRGNETVNRRVTASADSETNNDIAVGATTTDKLVNIAIDVSELKSLYLSSDQDVLVQTNDGTSPDDVVTLKAGVPVIWYPDCGYASPLTEDVTKIYLTNAGATAATVNIRVLQDSTP
jgi:hypothetical protein